MFVLQIILEGELRTLCFIHSVQSMIYFVIYVYPGQMADANTVRHDYADIFSLLAMCEKYSIKHIFIDFKVVNHKIKLVDTIMIGSDMWCGDNSLLTVQ